jgi:predicted MFS family arabinose efflux permease
MLKNTSTGGLVRVGRDTVSDTARSSLSRGHIWLMALVAGMAAANLYYIQPLLPEVARSFSVSSGQIGLVATLIQIGYAGGLLFIVPLGDSYNRRSLIIGALLASMVALIAVAVSPDFIWLVVAGILLGITTIVAQLVTPYAASLAAPENRGRVLGTVLTGLFLGILLARTVSGWVGTALGWRSMYWIAAASMLLMAVLVRVILPADRTTKERLSYPQLLASLWKLLSTEPVVRESSLYGGLGFAAFNAFWVTLAFFLATPPYHFGPAIAGTFGLVGAIGTIAANFVGRIADRGNTRLVNGAALGVMLLSFLILWLTGQVLVGLIIGVIVLDMGSRANMTLNQANVYSVRPESRNRINAIFMVCYYLGGALGSLFGTIGWNLARWNGVNGVACALLLIALIFYFLRFRGQMRT